MFLKKGIYQLCIRPICDFFSKYNISIDVLVTAIVEPKITFERYMLWCFNVSQVGYNLLVQCINSIHRDLFGHFLVGNFWFGYFSFGCYSSVQIGHYSLSKLTWMCRHTLATAGFPQTQIQIQIQMQIQEVVLYSNTNTNTNTLMRRHTLATAGFPQRRIFRPQQKHIVHLISFLTWT